MNEIAFPISSESAFEKDIHGFFEALSKTVGSTGYGVAIHEVVEVSLLKHVGAKGPYWRWFSDGFANAVTFEILRRHVGQKEAKQFGATSDIARYRDLENQINLGYWMSGAYGIFLHGGPVDYEQRFTAARYAYATHEAQRLIDKQGIECVKEILDEVRKAEAATSEVLLATIKKVTGEDMSGRLKRYQTFATREEGFKKYGDPFNKASDNKDYEQMLTNLLRIIEMQESQYSPDSLQGWYNAALILYKMGYGEKGCEVMEHCVGLFSSSPVPGSSEVAIDQMCQYVLTCGRPQMALEYAQELLQTVPDSAPALSVVMLMKVKGGELEEAKEIATKLQNLARSEKDKRSLSYQAASWVLGIGPDHPAVGAK
jgi:hypothetical protein